jgi:hypothetical protein
MKALAARAQTRNAALQGHQEHLCCLQGYPLCRCQVGENLSLTRTSSAWGDLATISEYTSKAFVMVLHGENKESDGSHRLTGPFRSAPMATTASTLMSRCVSRGGEIREVVTRGGISSALQRWAHQLYIQSIDQYEVLLMERHGRTGHRTVSLSSSLLILLPLPPSTQDMPNTTGSWDMYGQDDAKRYPALQATFFNQAADVLTRREAVRAFVALFGIGAIATFGYKGAADANLPITKTPAKTENGKGGTLRSRV